MSLQALLECEPLGTVDVGAFSNKFLGKTPDNSHSTAVHGIYKLLGEDLAIKRDMLERSR
jgi:hypothetical protein